MQLAFLSGSNKFYAKFNINSKSAGSTAPNPFEETWSKYLRSSCIALALSSKNRCRGTDNSATCQLANWRNWVNSLSETVKMPHAKESVEELCTQLGPSMHLTCYDSFIRANLMPPKQQLQQNQTGNTSNNNTSPIPCCLEVLKVFRPFAYSVLAFVIGFFSSALCFVVFWRLILTVTTTKTWIKV